MGPMVTCSDQKKELIGLEIRVKGVVQGVGFRPYIYRLALAHNLRGWVRNENGSVLIRVEGPEANINAFSGQIIEQKPRLARISALEQKRVHLENYDIFSIDLSKGSTDHSLGIPADIAACAECLDELRNPADRHYLYPFTNCTNCGPRFTIIEATPYDREKTSMKHFLACPDCDQEYHDPADRRFHAQPVACPACGPQVRIMDHHGRLIISEAQWLKFFHDQISLGKIFAVKGLGGFHLCCAANKTAVAELRRRKNRPSKPFALLCRNLETAAKYCHISEREAAWLSSPQAPVVLLAAAENCALPSIINPSFTTLGIMLPYTPLHSLIMSGPHEILIFTSANAGGLPLVKDDHEAQSNLRGIADYYLTHNRQIIQRCDDSVVSLKSGGLQIHRRSRGFTPTPLTVGLSCEATVLGAGAEMKNTFCVLKGNEAVLSQHQGEIDTVEAERVYLENLNQMMKMMNTGIDVVGFDLHPAYNVSSLARNIDADKYYGIYHHHAHFASCLAENGFDNEAIGVILDGTGYGEDGAIWGFEILSGDLLSYNREYQQSYIPQPGGELASGSPWRIAVSYLRQAMGTQGLAAADELFGNRFKDELAIMAWQLEQNINTILSSSCGRLFDAVASMLNLCHLNTYDGQAAIQLSELLVSETPATGGEHYTFGITDDQIILLDMFPEIYRDIKAGLSKKHIARCFHDTLALAISEAVSQTARRTGLATVALSGGTWLNPYLLKKTVQLLKESNYDVLLQKQVPPNDGGLSLGQAAIASRRLINNVPGYTNAPVGVKQ